MNTPPLLAGSTLVFWGVLTGNWIAGLLMAVGIESLRFLKIKINFKESEVLQILNITILLFLGLLVLTFTSNEGVSAMGDFFSDAPLYERTKALDRGASAVFEFLKILPVVFFPLMFAQQISVNPDWNIKGIDSKWIRRIERRFSDSDFFKKGFNIYYFYIVVCLISASAVKTERYEFFAGAIVICIWMSWYLKPVKMLVSLWYKSVILFCIAVVSIGFGTLKLVGIVREFQFQLFSRPLNRVSEINESRTAIGSIGRIKMSGKIVLRVQSPPGQAPPSLLREACYNIFKSPSWYADRSVFVSVYPETNETSWVLSRAVSPEQSVTVSKYLKGGAGLLPVANGTVALDNLKVYQMETNNYGVVRVSFGQGLVIYDVKYSTNFAIDSPPNNFDLVVPQQEEFALSAIVDELKLNGMSPADAAYTVESYFQKNYRYSTYLRRALNRGTNDTPLSYFLLKSKTGHCEYFATAGTLLLRKAGIPTRYVVGYSIQESAGEGRFIVRERHSHAWFIYYDSGSGVWRECDPTPPGWSLQESFAAPLWEPISDFFSNLWFNFSKLRWGYMNLRRYIIGILVVAIGILIGRVIYSGIQQRKKEKGSAILDKDGLFLNKTSAFYKIERLMREYGYGRKQYETMLAWVQRVRPVISQVAPQIEDLIKLHYRFRFDPAGLTDEQIKQYEVTVEECATRVGEYFKQNHR